MLRAPSSPGCDLPTTPPRLAIVDAQRSVGDDAVRLADGRLGASHAHEQQTYAAQSEYAASLDRWVDAVGRDRLAIVFSEDYYADPARVIATVLDAAGLPPMPAGHESEHRNAAPRPSTLDADLDAELTERFRPDVRRLVERYGLTPPWPRFVGDRA